MRWLSTSRWVRPVLCWSAVGCSGPASAGPGVQAIRVEPAASAAPTLPAPPEQLGPIPNLRISDVSVGANHACALAASGEVWCWGANYVNQVDPSRSDVYIPVRIPLPLAATNVVVSDSGSCALLSDGRRACWPSLQSEGFEIESSPRFERLVPVLPTNCGMTHDQELVCGGSNYFGVLGFPSNPQAKPGEELPHRVVPLPRPVKEVALAADFGCAVAGREQELFCWGNGWGCNGPKRVDLPAKVSALSGAGARVCLLTSDGDVYQFTALPEPEPPAPRICRDDAAARTPVAKIAEGATQVSCYAGEYTKCSMCSGCIVDRQQQVSCWYELGPHGVVVLDDEGGMHTKPNTDAERARSRVPALVKGVSHPKRIAVGDAFYCALMESGLLQCWGNNSRGQLGRGESRDLEEIPAEPAWPLGPSE